MNIFINIIKVPFIIVQFVLSRFGIIIALLSSSHNENLLLQARDGVFDLFYFFNNLLLSAIKHPSITQIFNIFSSELAKYSNRIATTIQREPKSALFTIIIIYCCCKIISLILKRFLKLGHKIWQHTTSSEKCYQVMNETVQI
ncbi:MAG: hypothetical protein ABIE74_10780 [Pseudomonadota bacterium]